MSEKTNEEWQDEQVLELLDDMVAEPVKGPRELLSGSDDASRSLRRECASLLSLLPYALESVSVSPELKETVLAQAQLRPPSKRAEEAPAQVHRMSPSPPGWLMPLAATLAIVLVTVTGWQIWRVEQQSRTIAWLSVELEQARMDAAELAMARQELAETQARLQMMTASTAEFCALRPTESCPNQQARGTLVMRRDQSDWFLRVEGLGPCEKGRQYKLWFVTDSKPVLGASFAVKGSHELVEIRATGAPAGVTAVMITLEEPEVEAAPEAPVLLFGDQTMRIL